GVRHGVRRLTQCIRYVRPLGGADAACAASGTLEIGKAGSGTLVPYFLQTSYLVVRSNETYRVKNILIIVKAGQRMQRARAWHEASAHGFSRLPRRKYLARDQSWQIHVEIVALEWRYGLCGTSRKLMILNETLTLSCFAGRRWCRYANENRRPGRMDHGPWLFRSRFCTGGMDAFAAADP